MANSLIRSNRNVEFTAEENAKASDFDNKDNKTEKESSTVDTVTFDTNIKISNHTRNKLQAMATLGFARDQKSAVDIIFAAYREGLPIEERKELDTQIATFETRDVRLKNKK